MGRATEALDRIAMKTTERPLLADLRAELGAMGGELREMASARWELARLELQADLLSVKRLAIAWLAAAVMALAALPLLAVCAAEALDGCGNIPRGGWLLIFADGLLMLALGGSYFAWRRFRRRFVGLQETLEELREDLVWLQEKGEGKMTKHEARMTNDEG
jgi:hypothetical protein